ncbi:hypothetical protein OWV82_004254 [Melia azedarach]|uniref:Uncharacterized protein n=4 Tax=Melia azedarach TaxID=155640 RepID=A0ACC1YNH7_MELAZ|nr:hypothetical protein OWV82_004223 [Melia azedarach]KAJ4725345.1 hypothetical protein OWV82_004231 [Melia azedarach]KAJ4725346.1 hypothetical protein OWV82_004231 [Melia azedarach]KAJ4725374.1 hypothetical protein OWV82_004254 [Melia azedarach]
MPVSNAIAIATSPVLIPGKTSWCKEHMKLSEYQPVRLSMGYKPSIVTRGKIKLSAPGPIGLGLQLRPIDRRRSLSACIVCASASGQTQTVTREAPTITVTKAPANEKSPKLDDGGTGFPPRDDGGGGGGGGGGGNWSGGFFLFGFLAFLGFLKDNEGEENYRDGNRR